MTNISFDLQAVAELADLRDALIQLARTRLSFRQVVLIMILEFFILISMMILEVMKTMSWHHIVTFTELSLWHVNT